MANGPAVMRSFVGGLGGKDVSDDEFDHLLSTLEAARPEDPPADVELLMTQSEWLQVARSLTVAGKEGGDHAGSS
jgi:hypothetical protein